MLAVQYLEDGPGVPALGAGEVRARLQDALERLPISRVLLGWNLPHALVRACAEASARAGARLLRWHPLLTGDGTFLPRAEWRVIGLNGEPVPAFQGLPEFTFVCPNRPEVLDAALDHMRAIMSRGYYQGIFLDRIRYPSPASDPARLLACFCEDCHRAAWTVGVDLDATRRQIELVLPTGEGPESFLRAALSPGLKQASDPGLDMLRALLQFRAQSISRFVGAVADAIRDEGLEVGLDCFSPSLTRMVGQDLTALDARCDWIKIMTYGHTFGPAGLPFELLSLADWLVDQGYAYERKALEWLSQASKLPLPVTRAALCEQGLSPDALHLEVERARAAGVRALLAGIELVDLEGTTRLDGTQIVADLAAVCAAGVDGLVLSWDLWHIPRERLDLVKGAWMPHR